MRLYLVKNGVPFDVAFGSSDDWALAAYVVFGEYEGNEFDWASMTWQERT